MVSSTIVIPDTKAQHPEPTVLHKVHDYVSSFFHRAEPPKPTIHVPEKKRFFDKITLGHVACAGASLLGAYIASKIGYAIYQSFTEKSLKGKVALITGGGGRLPKSLGRLTALRLAKEGAKVVIVDIDGKGIQQVVDLITRNGGQAVGYQCDIGDYKNVYEMAEKVKKEVGTVDLLINNAGIVQGKPILEADERKIEATFKVNTMAHFWTVKAFLPGMLEKGEGQIVNIASVAGMVGSSCMTDYSASKFACVGFHESLLAEAIHKKYPIKCTCICPYYIDTGMFEGINSMWGILNPLNADRVADRIITAIKRRELMVVIPSYLRTVNSLWRILAPDSFGAQVAVKSGLGTSMENFEGHAKPPPSPCPAPSK